MPTGNEWHHLHGIFLEKTPALLMRADECLTHLELIDDDSDAVEALLDALHTVATLADKAQLDTVGRFSLTLNGRVREVWAAGRLAPATLSVLRQCIALLAWQFELVDLTTGLLPLDDSEQRELLAHLASSCGIGHRPHQATDYCRCPQGSAYPLRLPEQR